MHLSILCWRIPWRARVFAVPILLVSTMMNWDDESWRSMNIGAVGLALYRTV
jgi:hypothetical protein